MVKQWTVANYVFFIFVLSSIINISIQRMITPGIMSENIIIHPQMVEYMGFPQPALNKTEVEIKFICSPGSKLIFNAEAVIRSSPCDREFYDTTSNDAVNIKNMLTFYFNNNTTILPTYDYTEFMYYRSKPMKFNCEDSHGAAMFLEQYGNDASEFHKIVTQKSKKSKRSTPMLNGNTIDGGTNIRLSSWHPLKSLPIDAIYFLIIKITPDSGFLSNTTESIQLDVQWRAPNGYLNAIDYPLLNFYKFMVIIYTIMLFIWLYLCARKWKDLLKIQFWIGIVILVGLIEKAVFLSEFSTVNETGYTTGGMIEFAEIISAFKRTLSRVLILIVSIGYGVVKPRLGETLNQITVVGGLYFVFSAIEGLIRTSWKSAEAIKERQLATLPLVFFEVIIFWWIFTSLTSTIRALKIRNNDVKLRLYSNFANVLGISIVASVIFMLWFLINHVFRHCLMNWKELWFDTAFWHFLFCSVLIAIMILWRPANNNQRFAFTPLLDDSEDECDESFPLGTSCVDDVVLKRTKGIDVNSDKVKKSDIDDKIESDLKWIEENIPTTFAERFLLDEADDVEKTELEIDIIMSDNTFESTSDVREVFNSYDTVGDEKIYVKQLGDVLRALDLSPTEAEIIKYASYYKSPDERISYEDFLYSYQIARKSYNPVSMEEIIEGLSHFDKEGNGMIKVVELRHILTTLGERLADEEVDKLIDGHADSRGNIYIADFVRKIIDFDH
uniref:EF-hand domain-containing protein n=1 Tax=Strongyloides stercoralis TaxID=6248 RepID=A0A0K0ES04_STRER